MTTATPLSRAVTRAGLANDPLGDALHELEVLVVRVETASQATRQPFSDADRATITRTVRDAVQQGAATAGRSMVRRTAILSGAIVAVTGLLCGAGGYLLGRSTSQADVAALGVQMSGPAARAWLDIVRANPDPRPALAAQQSWVDARSGLRAAELRVYLETAPNGVPARR